MAYISDLDETYCSIIDKLKELSDIGFLYRGNKKRYDVYFTTPLTKRISKEFNVNDLFYYIVRLNYGKYHPYVVLEMNADNRPLAEMWYDLMKNETFDSALCEDPRKTMPKEPFVYWQYLCSDTGEGKDRSEEITCNFKIFISNKMKNKESCLERAFNTLDIQKMKIDHPEYFEGSSFNGVADEFSKYLCDD